MACPCSRPIAAALAGSACSPLSGVRCRPWRPPPFPIQWNFKLDLREALGSKGAPKRTPPVHPSLPEKGVGSPKREYRAQQRPKREFIGGVRALGRLSTGASEIFEACVARACSRGHNGRAHGWSHGRAHGWSHGGSSGQNWPRKKLTFLVNSVRNR